MTLKVFKVILINYWLKIKLIIIIKWTFLLELISTAKTVHPPQRPWGFMPPTHWPHFTEIQPSIWVTPGKKRLACTSFSFMNYHQSYIQFFLFLSVELPDTFSLFSNNRVERTSVQESDSLPAVSPVPRHCAVGSNLKVKRQQRHLNPRSFVF